MIFVAKERYIHNGYKETIICLQQGAMGAGKRFSRARFGLGRFGAIMKIEENEEQNNYSLALQKRKKEAVKMMMETVTPLADVTMKKKVCTNFNTKGKISFWFSSWGSSRFM